MKNRIFSQQIVQRRHIPRRHQLMPFLNRINLHKIVEIDNKLIRKMEPGYMYPVMKNGMSHFFASVKRVGNYYMPAVLFNILAVWIMTLVFYLILQFSLLRRTLEFFGTIRRREVNTNGN